MLKTPAGWICALILLYLTYPGILFLVSICVCNLLWAHFFLLSMHKSYSIKKIQIQRCTVVELLMNSVRTEHPCIFSFFFFFFDHAFYPKCRACSVNRVWSANWATWQYVFIFSSVQTVKMLYLHFHASNLGNRYRSFCCHTTRLQSGSIPQAVRLLSSSFHLLYSECVMQEQVLSQRNQ